MILGPPLGGWITDMVGWRYCFQLNIIPVMAITYVYVFRLNNYNAPKEDTCILEKIKAIDFGGAFLLTFGILALAIVLMSGGNTHNWDDHFIITMILVSLVAFIGFGIYERRQGNEGLLKPETASNRNVITTCITALGNCTSDSGILILLPQYLTVSMGYMIAPFIWKDEMTSYHVKRLYMDPPFQNQAYISQQDLSQRLQGAMLLDKSSNALDISATF